MRAMDCVALSVMASYCHYLDHSYRICQLRWPEMGAWLSRGEEGVGVSWSGPYRSCMWEPFLVLPKEAPDWDPAFKGRGYNKIQHAIIYTPSPPHKIHLSSYI